MVTYNAAFFPMGQLTTGLWSAGSACLRPGPASRSALASYGRTLPALRRTLCMRLYGVSLSLVASTLFRLAYDHATGLARAL